MSLNRVTITGADDQTPIQSLIDLSAEFPFAEWAILVSLKQECSPRFPSREWCAGFAVEAEIHDLKVSLHVCGKWVRQLLRGQLDWRELPVVLNPARRIQINTHAEEHISTLAAFDQFRQKPDKQFIVQLDAVNDHILDAAVSRKLNVAGLFDQSHGAGVLPTSWPKPRHYGIYHGFAGGLGPHNVVEQVEIIDNTNVCMPFWIDMENQVRTNEQLDLAKVRRVLELCAPLVLPEPAKETAPRLEEGK